MNINELQMAILPDDVGESAAEVIIDAIEDRNTDFYKLLTDRGLVRAEAMGVLESRASIVTGESEHKSAVELEDAFTLTNINYGTAIYPMSTISKGFNVGTVAAQAAALSQDGNILEEKFLNATHELLDTMNWNAFNGELSIGGNTSYGLMNHPNNLDVILPTNHVWTATNHATANPTEDVADMIGSLNDGGYRNNMTLLVPSSYYGFLSRNTGVTGDIRTWEEVILSNPQVDAVVLVDDEYMTNSHGNAVVAMVQLDRRAVDVAVSPIVEGQGSAIFAPGIMKSDGFGTVYAVSTRNAFRFKENTKGNIGSVIGTFSTI